MKLGAIGDKQFARHKGKRRLGKPAGALLADVARLVPGLFEDRRKGLLGLAGMACRLGLGDI